MSTQKQTNSRAVERGDQKSRPRIVVAAAALSALAAGCASANAVPAASSTAPASSSSTVPTAPAAPTVSPDMPMSPGMSMPATTRAAAPSASAVMICGPEIQKAVTTILSLRSTPTTTTAWADHLYTCTYHLPTGRLVLSVEESPDTAAANAYFATLRQRLGSTHPLTGAQGLGNPGYESAGGTVVVLKDGKILQVDATGMPPVSGPQLIARADLAYEIATDILGCWSE